jgi:acyl-CoA synthetase (NDP forming)
MPWRKNHRPVYGRAELQRLIDPASVAIIGLSAGEGGFGTRTLMNMRACADVRVYGVNPKADRLHGVPCFPTIGEVPERIDCAIIATPRERVESLVEQCAAAGVGGCIIYASGYAETGKEERVQEQLRLAEIARQSGLRIVGPNCIGLIDNFRHLGMLFLPTYELTPWRPGPVGLISQSGALGYTLAQACERGGNFSHYLTAGNSCDVDVCDFISYLADDPDCGVITCLVEGVKDGERLIEAGERALAADKPVVLYKMATGNAAAQAAMSHTGSLTGANAAYDSAFRRCGIVSVENLEQVYETAQFFAKAGKPKATGVAVMATSGGACVIAADKAELYGVPLPQPAPEVLAVLESVIPEFGSPRNPCDVTAQVINDPALSLRSMRAMLEDPAYGTMVLPQVAAGQLTVNRVPVVAALAEELGKPICIAWINEWLEGPGADLYEANPHTAVFRSSDRCFRAIAAWHWRDARRRALPPAPRRVSGKPAADAARRLLGAAGERLSEAEAKALLHAYGVPVARDALVQNADEAAAAAAEMGYPVVVKIDSADIPHKTEAGVVKLGLNDEASLRRAVAEVIAAAARIAPAPRINGISVQPMIAAGTELVVGARLDPQFGPLVVVGMGGILVELLADTAAELAPVDAAQARRMLEGLRGYKLLTGYRGARGVDIDRIAAIVVAISELATDLADEIAEIDVNPIICSPDRITAVDALIVRGGGGS